MEDLSSDPLVAEVSVFCSKPKSYTETHSASYPIRLKCFSFRARRGRREILNTHVHPVSSFRLLVVITPTRLCGLALN